MHLSLMREIEQSVESKCLEFSVFPFSSYFFVFSKKWGFIFLNVVILILAGWCNLWTRPRQMVFWSFIKIITPTRLICCNAKLIFNNNIIIYIVFCKHARCNEERSMKRISKVWTCLKVSFMWRCRAWSPNMKSQTPNYSWCNSKL